MKARSRGSQNLARMELHFPDLEYDCLCCGKGCRQDWKIPVEARVLAGIQNSSAAAAVGRRGYVPLEELGGGSVLLGRTEERSCVFLREDHLCAIHAEAGYQAKPLQCRQFPFLPVSTPSGIYVGLSFLCTAVQRRHGRPVEGHREQVRSLVEELAAKLGGARSGEMEIPVSPECSVDWNGYLLLEQFVQRRLEEPNLRAGLSRAAVALSRLAGPGDPESVPTSADPELLEELTSLFQASLVGLVETDVPEERPGISRGVLNGEPVYSRRLDESVDCSGVHAEVTMLGHPGWLQDEYRRYLSHLVFRKFLIQGPTVQARTCTLLVLLSLLDFYLVLSMKRAGRQFPEPEDLWSALDVLEGDVVTHASGMERIFGLLGETFRQQLTAG
ncbi:MAG: YkgJ family cysteine cluster protein [Armatimonadetes bacterium]|nr:YkgJ family cysteine cluster protein [Armatimonadota bacterium]